MNLPLSVTITASDVMLALPWLLIRSHGLHRSEPHDISSEYGHVLSLSAL